MNTETETQQPAVAVLAMADIECDASHNPRKFKSQRDLETFRESIRSEGVLQPIVVRPKPDQGYQVVAGFTRFAMAKEVGHRSIPALIRELTDSEALTVATVENVHRVSLSPIDEGRAARSLLIRHKNDTASVLSTLGWTKKKLDSRILLTHAVEAVGEALVNKKIAIGHAEILAGLRPQAQEAALKKVVDEGISVADLKHRIEAAALKLSLAVFDTKDCSQCHHNSSVQTSLFDTGFEKSRCLNKSCFSQKTGDRLAAIQAEQKECFPLVQLDSEVAADTHTLLVKTGGEGVGEAQYEACQSCQHYGVVIRTGLGQAGQVDSHQCFNRLCHNEKMAAYQALLKSTTTTSCPGKTAETGEAPAPETAANKPPAKAACLSSKLIECHHKVHRKAAAAEVRQTPKIAKAMALLAVMHESGIGPEKMPKSWPRSLSGTGRGVALGLLLQLTGEKLDAMLTELCARVLEKSTGGDSRYPEQETTGASAVQIVRSAQISLAEHFIVDKNYLQLLTKTAIAELLSSSGFAAHYQRSGQDYQKLLTGRKDELLTVVETSDFNFSGYLPASLAITGDSPC